MKTFLHIFLLRDLFSLQSNLNLKREIDEFQKIMAQNTLSLKFETYNYICIYLRKLAASKW